MSTRKASTSNLTGARYTDASAATSKIADIPDVPTIGTVVPTALTASVPFTQSNTGGIATSYTVISTPGDIVQTVSSSPASYTGLTNNTNYTFKVKAINSSGESAYSSSSNSVLAISYAPTTIDYLVVGGGAGGDGSNGGSGAGRVQSASSYSVSAATDYSITIGGGGTNGGGGTSSAFALSSGTGSKNSGQNGGSSGNGFSGGSYAYMSRYYAYAGGGGAGAGGNGSNGSTGGNYPGTQEPNYGGPGGTGVLWNGTYFGGGGGGAMSQAYGYYGGPGGGGAGGGGGSANTGGGANGGGQNGGSGVVKIKYPNTAAALSSIGAGLTYSYTDDGTYKWYTFTGGTGNIRW